MTQHADFEALSAFVDGEAPEWAAHVDACAACRATADELRGVAAAVRAPVEAPDPRMRELAIQAALGDPARGHAAERVRPHRRRFNWQLNLAAAAAMVLGMGALLTVLWTQGASDETTTVAGPALEAAPKSDLAERAPAADSAGVADLGDVRDAATLLARARPATPSAGAAGAAASPTTAFSARTAAPSATPGVVGTRPCEEQARTRDAGLREVVYFAVARQGSVPAYVLGFSTGPSPAPVTLLLLAQNGCAELLRAAGP